MSTRTKQLSQQPPVRSRGSAASAGSRASAGAAGPAPRVRQHTTYQASVARHLSWKASIALFVGIVAIGLIIAYSFVSQASIPKGRLVAASNTSYDFGTVRIGGGDITTRFPLTVDGDAEAVDITST